MSNKEIYQQLCASHKMPLFMQSWWLEGACAGYDWDVLLSLSTDGEVRGAWPYLVRKRMLVKWVELPTETPYGGVWLSPTLEDKQIDEVADDLLRQMEEKKFAYFSQRFVIDDRFIQHMTAYGYKTRQYVTYQIDTVTDAEKAVQKFSRSKRKKLELETWRVEDIEAERFYSFHKASLHQKNRDPWYSREFLIVMMTKAAEHDQCRLISVVDHAGEEEAVGCLLWDTEKVYLYLNGFDHAQKDNGAREVVIREAVREAAKRHLKVDFLSYRSFWKSYDAHREAYWMVTKTRRFFMVLLQLADWYRHKRQKR